MNSPNLLSLEEILLLHYQVIEDYGGAHGVRDQERLISVVKAPAQQVFGEEQYSGIHQKAAVYLRNIIADHPFVDGNKRTGVTAAAIYLARNNFQLTVQPKELEDFAVKVAKENLSIEQVAKWLKQQTAQS